MRHRSVSATFKFLLLIACATAGGAALVVSLSAYCSLVIFGNPISSLAWQGDEYGGVGTLISMGIVTGVFGFGYVHVLVAYGLIFRNIPDFWRALPKYFIILFLGTFAASILFMHTLGGEAPAAEASVLAVPIGFWGTALLLDWKRRRAKVD